MKCGLEHCTCSIDLGETYCHDECRAAASETPDAAPRGRCRCRHIDCVAR